MTEPKQLTPETAFARLQAWYVKQGELKELKQEEVIERKLLAPFYFPEPREGTNRIDLGGGFDLKLDHGYNYKVDEAELDNVTAAQIKKLKLPWDDLFVYKPELSVTTYRGLTSEQKKFVDQLLVITDATPQLSIVPSGKPQRAPEPEQAAGTEPNFVEDMEAAKCGDYYEDGDGQVWLVTVYDEATGEQEWEAVDDPRAAAVPEKPKRKPRTKKS